MTLRILAPTLISLLSVGLCLGVSPAAASQLHMMGARPNPPPPEPRPEDLVDVSVEPETNGDAAADELDQADPVGAVDPADQAPEQVVDVVLPCGLRVITAKDASLPVAAVVLALELGTRDDPDNLPGLIHALAYHLQQGNRELAPGEAIATAHDVGGLAAMAVGVAQVRFESLIPISQLDAQLRIEGERPPHEFSRDEVADILIDAYKED